MKIEPFYNEHIDKVYKFFYVQSLNRAVAEDLTSQTFLTFVEILSHSNAIENHKKYLYGIMRNVWYGFLREKYEQRLEQIEDIDDFEDFTQNEVRTYESRTLAERAALLIEKLPEKQQCVVRMRLLEELSVGEVAELLERDRHYVKITYHRGIKRLRTLLENPYEIDESEGAV